MNNLQRLHQIVELQQCDHLHFGRHKVLVDAQTARVMVNVYRALGTNDAKGKFVRMTETEVGFARLVGFCWRHTGG